MKRGEISKPMADPMFRFASLGLGVQSTTLALMAAHGEIEPFDALIVADPRAETRAIYEHLRFLQSGNINIGAPIITVSAGDLGATTMASVESWAALGGAETPRHLWRTASRVANPPFFTRGPRIIEKTVHLEALPLLGIPAETVDIIVERVTERETFGMLRRGCTKEYKIEPITAYIRERMGLAHGEPGPSHQVIELSIGLTSDELERVSTSASPFIYHRHPLIEKRMTRPDSIAWLLRHGYPIPPKSRCWFCPYQSDELWRDMKENNPEDWADAVAFDRAIRNGIRGTTTKLYLHSSRLPLDEVDFSRPPGLWSIEGMRNECEGACGT